MKYITTIMKKIMSKESTKPVGRWNIERCHSKLDLKIDLSNEDHCGPCGQYVLSKIHFKPTKNDYPLENRK